MITLHADSDWIRAFLPHGVDLAVTPDLTDSSTGTIAAKCFYGDAEIQPEIDSLADRFDHVIVYICSPWCNQPGTPADDRDLLPLALRESASNVMIFSDVVMDVEPPNHRHVGNWFLCHDNLYASTNWSRDIMAQLRDDVDHKRYRFDALLGVHRPNKTAVYDRWRSGAYQDQILLTYHGKDATNGIWDVPYVPEPADMPQDDNDQSVLAVQLWSYMPNEHGEAVHKVGSHYVLPLTIYNDCWYSIVTETFNDTRGSYYTEKIAKALVAARVFVLFGAQHDLRRLRRLGFHSFGHVIDESFDAIADPQARYAAAWQQVEWLCDQDPQRILAATRFQREMNQRVFVNTDWYANLRHHLRDICAKY